MKRIKSLPKGIFEDDYKKIRDNLAFIFRTKDIDALERGKLNLDKFGKEKNRYKDGLEAFKDLREIPIGLGELFYDMFKFSGHKVVVRGFPGSRTNIPDWSTIRNKLFNFASYIKSTHKGTTILVKKAEEIQKALNRMNLTLANISMDFSHR